MNGIFPQTAGLWLAAMALMMAPMAMPTLHLLRRACGRHDPGVVWGFACGYAGIWSGFSLGLAGVQTGLRAAGWPPPATALLLLAAGLYQFSPWKTACLRRCRSPLNQLLSLQHPGWRGGLALGGEYGLNCLGCCWVVMLTMLGAGMMAPAAMLALALLLTGERLLPVDPRLVARANGVVLLSWALWSSAENLRGGAL